MSSPRPHCASRRSRSEAKPSARRCITVATNASASSTAPRGSSTKRTWISSQRLWNSSAPSSSGAGSSSPARPAAVPASASSRRAGSAPLSPAATAPSSAASRSVRSSGTGAASAGGESTGSASAVSRSASGSWVPDAMSRVLRRSSSRSICSAPDVRVLGGALGAVVDAVGAVLGPAVAGALDALVAEELGEQRPEVDHRLAQILGARVARGGPGRDAVRGAVVLDHLRVIDRHVGGALLELVGDRVAALAHDLDDERVGLADGGGGLVDEPPLRGAPALDVAVARAGVELADLELLAALAALLQLGLGLAAVAAALLDGALVLGAEALLQLLGLPLAHQQDGSDHRGDHDDRQDHVDHALSFRFRRRRSAFPSTSAYPFEGRGTQGRLAR